jgi:hypothetical protein
MWNGSSWVKMTDDCPDGWVCGIPLGDGSYIGEQSCQPCAPP